MNSSPDRSRVLIDDPGDDSPQRPPQKRQRGRFAPEHDIPPANTATAPLRPRSAPAGLIASDRVEGAREFALFLYGSDDQKSIRRAYHAIRRNRVPAGKDGGMLIGSKAKILAHWDRLTVNKSTGQGRDEETP
jgi:hypothetical protein